MDNINLHLVFLILITKRVVGPAILSGVFPIRTIIKQYVFGL